MLRSWQTSTRRTYNSMTKPNLAIIAFALSLIFFHSQVFAQEQKPSLLRELQKADAENLAKAVIAKGDAVRGAILFSQKSLNCATCHAQGQRDRVGPDLTQLKIAAGKSLELHLIEALLYPSKVIREGYESSTILTEDDQILKGRVVEKDDERIVIRESNEANRLVEVLRSEIAQMRQDKISAMPADLVDQLEDRQAFLDLVQYLRNLNGSSSSANSASTGMSVALPDRIAGLAWIDHFACANCHDQLKASAGITFGAPTKRGPNLRAIATRAAPDFVNAFIADPHGKKPETSMPVMLSGLSKEEQQQVSEAILHYLWSQDQPIGEEQTGSQDNSAGQAAKSVTPQDSDFAAAKKRGERLFHHVGCVACHSPRNEKNEEILAEQSVALGTPGEKYTSAGLVAFLKNPHSARPAGRMPNMRLDHWEAVDLACYLIGTETTSHKALTVNSKLAMKGKRFFAKYGCSSCHDSAEKGTLEQNPVFASVEIKDWYAGCLSETQGDWPSYRFRSDQLKSIRAALEQSQQPLKQDDQALASFAALNCLNCHRRQEYGGVDDVHDVYFHTENENLGPQGRLPPTLTGVGAKLKQKWLRDVLVNGKAIRPYMNTRMPQYGEENVGHLVELLGKCDAPPEVEMAHFTDVKETRKQATEMIGSQGLNCVACHTFQEKPAQTMPAVDLTEMSDRLRPEWFYAYMMAPQSLSPNTVMPSFWPGGKAMREQFFDGDTKQQIGAIWEYLQDGRQARTPRGIRMEPIKLLAAKDRAVMLRRSYQNIGKRGIGVGYSNQANIAYDAEQMRVAMFWAGEFADPGGVWRGQGSGTVRPLARPQVLAKGPDLDRVDAPWKVDNGRPSNHQFLGYSLDKSGRPTFRYRFGQIQVQDKFEDRDAADVSVKATLHRTVRFETPEPVKGLRYRLLSGGPLKLSIDKDGNKSVWIGNVAVETDGNPQIEVKEENEKLAEVWLLLDLPAGKTSVEIDYGLRGE